MTEDTTVYVVEDDEAEREALSSLIEALGYQVVRCATAKEFWRLFDADQPGCVLLDVCMPEASGLEIQHQLVKQFVETPIIIVTGYGDIPMAVQAMSQGAFYFLEKPYRSHELTQFVNKAVAHDWQLRQRGAKFRDTVERMRRLTQREREVMDLVVKGEPNKRIASRLHISARTVETHRANVMAKLEVDSVAELVEFSLTYKSMRETRSLLGEIAD